MKTLSKAEILAADDLPTEVVECPEWGGSVIVRTMSGRDRDRYEASMVTRTPGKAAQVNLADMTANLVAMTLVDEAGAMLFTPEDVAALGAKSSIALNRVFVVAQRLNGLAPSAVDVAEKNSVGGPSASSPSA